MTDMTDVTDRTDETDVMTTPTTAGAVRGAVEALAPEIVLRAAEVEAARRVPADLLDRLAATGAFGLLLPRSHGGVGADLPTTLGVVEALARADASVAWTVALGAGSWCDLAGLPRARFDALFDRTGAVVAGAFAPSGSATAVEGGYRVSGRWGFVSGCEDADWIYLNCLEGVVDGVPQLRIAVFPPDEVVIEDTWTVAGLCGTGSHHVHVDDRFVPADRTTRPMDDPPSIDEPIVHVPAPSLFSVIVAAVALGTAQGALDDVAALAAGKVPLLAPAPLAEQPLFQHDHATAVTEVRAARALLHEVAGELWATATRREPPTLGLRAASRATAAWATARAAAAVDGAYHAGGGTALYADSPLQRRLRDVHAVTQHFLVKADTLTTAGAVLLDQPLTTPVF